MLSAKKLLNSLKLSNYDLQIEFTEDLPSLADYEVVEDSVFDSVFNLTNTTILIEIPKSRLRFKDVLNFELILNVCAAKLDVDELEYRTNVDDGAFRILSVIAFGFSFQLMKCSNQLHTDLDGRFIRGLNLELSVSNDLIIYAYLYHLQRSR